MFGIMRRTCNEIDLPSYSKKSFYTYESLDDLIYKYEEILERREHRDLTDFFKRIIKKYKLMQELLKL